MHIIALDTMGSRPYAVPHLALFTVYLRRELLIKAHELPAVPWAAQNSNGFVPALTLLWPLGWFPIFFFFNLNRECCGVDLPLDTHVSKTRERHLGMEWLGLRKCLGCHWRQ